ncbi:MAG: DUF1259 domain-containing protein [Bdellovibrionota bacterium]
MGVRSSLLALSLLFLAACFSSDKLDDPLDLKIVTDFSGFSGRFDPATVVFKIELPREGRDVVVEGVRLPRSLAFTAQAALTGTRRRAVLVADIPLLETEVNPAIALALEAGLDVTSLHNRFLQDAPRVMSLHLSGIGTEEQLAAGVGGFLRGLLKLSKAPSSPVHPSAEPGQGTLDPKLIETNLWKGTFTDGVYHVTMGRSTRLKGQFLGDAMGLNSWASFAGTNRHAVVTGDIAMLEYELHDILAALLQAGFQVLSIHTHLTQEKPKMIFVHYWGSGKVADLARGVRDAIAAHMEKTTSQ